MLTEQALLEILVEWSFWKNPPVTGLIRQLAVPQQLTNDLALIIQGVRRCGKSTLLSQLPQHYNIPFKGQARFLQ